MRTVGHSVHHQSIDRVGSGLVVTARADDGTVEGVERPDAWVVGVQWHPEDTAAEDPVQQALFDAFVGECARVRARSS
jgi:putative glutamine amidotransferase